MSSVIKSFRVVETQYKENDNNIEILNEHSEIRKNIIEEANKEYKKILMDAELEATKIIEEAEKKAKEALNKSYEKSEEIFNDSKEEGYNKGIENGYKEGYETGYSEGKKDSDQLIKESLELKNQYINTRNNLLKELEGEIIQLVISIYEKLINKKTEEDNELIVSLVMNGINNLDLTDKLTVIVSKDDYNMLEMLKDDILAKSSMITDLEIKYDMELNKGDCIIETSKGNIDVSLKNQIEEVKELLTTILNNE